MESLTEHEKTTIKQSIFQCLTSSILPGFANANVLHRDLKTDNLLYLPFSQSVVACDFGVGVLTSIGMKAGPRGALKYYPIKAIDDSKYYEPWCDEYFATLSLLEILLESDIFSEKSTSQVIEERRNGILPNSELELLKTYPEAKSWISKIWAKDQSLLII